MASSRRGNNEGTAPIKRDDGRWAAAVKIPNGNRRWVYGKTRAETASKLADLQEAIRAGRLSVASGGNQTVKEYFRYWIDDVKRPQLRHRTYQFYRTRLAHVAKRIGGMKLSAVRAHHIQEVYAELLRDGTMTAESVCSLHVPVKGAFSAAVKYGYLYQNPLDGVALPRFERHSAVVFSPVDATDFLERITHRPYYPLWLLMLSTGIRIGEALGLEWDDVDWQARLIRIRRTAQHRRGVGMVTGPPKTKSSTRDVPLTDRCAAVLAGERERNPKALLVFPNEKGGLSSNAAMRLRLLADLKYAGFPPMRLHDLRHSYATIALSRGLNPKTVQKILGHNSIVMTMDLYGHFLPSMMDDARNLFDGLYASADGNH